MGGGDVEVVSVKGISTSALVTEASEVFQTSDIDQLGLLANLQALTGLSTDISESGDAEGCGRGRWRGYILLCLVPLSAEPRLSDLGRMDRVSSFSRELSWPMKYMHCPVLRSVCEGPASQA